MVTFNLYDALPQKLLQEWSKALARRPSGKLISKCESVFKFIWIEARARLG
jgi:hypothetical protein